MSTQGIAVATLFGDQHQLAVLGSARESGGELVRSTEDIQRVEDLTERDLAIALQNSLGLSRQRLSDVSHDSVDTGDAEAELRSSLHSVFTAEFATSAQALVNIYEYAGHEYDVGAMTVVDGRPVVINRSVVSLVNPSYEELAGVALRLIGELDTGTLT